jgi:KUP system potassium uptake protein
MLFLAIELSFLTANLRKVADGGWITMLIGFALFATMYIWWKGKRIKSGLTSFERTEDLIPKLEKLSIDENIPKYATNLVYLTTSNNSGGFEKSIVNSIFDHGLPKRADIYWFIHVNILDEPYAQHYTVETLRKDDLYFIVFDLGFREEPKIGYYFKQVVKEMISKDEVNLQRIEQEYQQDIMGDFRFVVLDSFLSYDNKMPFSQNFIMKSYYNLRHLSIKEHINFELDRSNVMIEKHPVVVVPFERNTLERKDAEPGN